jgi:toxin FitB
MMGGEQSRPQPSTGAALCRRQAGRPISQFDAQIAAITSAAGASVATRNGGDFEGCNIQVLNPWED